MYSSRLMLDVITHLVYMHSLHLMHAVLGYKTKIHEKKGFKSEFIGIKGYLIKNLSWIEMLDFLMQVACSMFIQQCYTVQYKSLHMYLYVIIEGIYLTSAIHFWIIEKKNAKEIALTKKV